MRSFFILVLSVLLLAYPQGPAPASASGIDIAFHQPIYINSDQGFTAANGVIAGNGTAANPYIIEGWNISGTKVWTSAAHRTNYLIALVRTAPKEEDRHAGMTQFIVDLSHSGVSVRPIYNLYGGHDFNEVVFDGFFAADDMVMGDVGMGWKLVTSELAFERSGPDRFLSTYRLLVESIRAIGADPDARSANEIGRFVAHLATLRRMSTSVAGMLERGAQPMVEAALVKDMGTAFEREIPETFRHLIATEPALGDGASYAELLGMTMLRAPGFTLRGGTREILRGVIARGLGLR